MATPRRHRERAEERDAGGVLHGPVALPPRTRPRRVVLPLAGVPRTRGACPPVRPCPYIQCRHHMQAVDDRDLAGRPRRGVRRLVLGPIDPDRSSCVLDLADRGPMSSEAIAVELGIEPASARLLVARALRRFRQLAAELDDAP